VKIFGCITFIAVLGLFIGSPARADIYSYTDEKGIAHFTNVPTDSRYKLLYRSTKNGQVRRVTRNRGTTSFPNRKRYQPLVAEAARLYSVDEGLLHSVIAVESGYNARAVSKKGAIGLMQLMPATAKRFGARDIYDPTQNIHAGAKYLRHLLQQFNNDIRLALAAYNAGEKAVVRYGNRVPPFTETRLYVPKVMSLYTRYRESSPGIVPVATPAR
jgi:soluble lytic murein transglycosylase-like protein